MNNESIVQENDVVLDIKDLTVRYVQDEMTVEAVNNISIQLKSGKILGLVGETGAGKTSTALAALNLIQCPPGQVNAKSINVCGHEMQDMSQEELERIRGNEISMIFQDPMTSLNPVFTVGSQIAEAVMLHEKCSKAKAMERAEEVLELVGIPRERASEYPHQFSGGMKQRVVIAIALCCNPKVLIADEPTTALDVTIQAQVLDLMRNLRHKFDMDGLKQIDVFNTRDSFWPRIENMVGELNQMTDCKVALHDLGDLDDLRSCLEQADLLVNTTPVGMPRVPGCLIPDPSYFHPGLVVSDVIYEPQETQLLKMAREAGLKTFNGMYMLLYQGAASFKLWTGFDMPVEQIKQKYFQR